MWIATQDGFFSAVQHREFPDMLVVRARSRSDLVRLTRIVIGTEIIKSPPGSDYPYRALLTKPQWSGYLDVATAEINYDNFKNRIHDVNDERASTYMAVWSNMLRIEQEPDSGVTRPAWDSYWETDQ